MKKILVIIDPQNDFVEGGALAVEGAKAKMELLTNYIKVYGKEYDTIAITMDWHPKNHCSFKENGGIWSIHCLQGSIGGLLVPQLVSVLEEYKHKVFFKGLDPLKEEYSIIQSNENGKAFLEYIKDADKIDVCGIAGDYCVKQTILDMCENGLEKKITVLPEYTASIDGGVALEELIASKDLSVYLNNIAKLEIERKFSSLSQKEQMELLDLSDDVFNSPNFKGLETTTIIYNVWFNKTSQEKEELISNI